MSADLAKVVNDLRIRRGLSVADLARESNVSNRTILQLENGALQKAYEVGTGRKRLAVQKVLKRLAHGLQLDVGELLSVLNDAGPRTKRSEPTLGVGAQAAVFDTWGWIRQALLAAPRAPLNIETGVLTYERNPHRPDFSEPRDRFYESFLSYIYRSVHGNLRMIVNHDSSPEQLTADLCSNRRRYRAVIGQFNIVSRMVGGVSFVPMPGLELRLACWTAYEGLAWSDVIKEQYREEADKLGIRVLTVKGQAGDVFIRGQCGYHEHDGGLVTCSQYDFEEIAERFVELYQQDWERKTKTVFVNSEYGASAIAEAIRARLQPDTSIFDIAGSGGVAAPRFHPSISFDCRDRAWREVIAMAIQECFRNAGFNLARIYADYFLALYQEHEDTLRRFAADQNFALPSFLSLHETSVALSPDFRGELYALIKEGLVKTAGANLALLHRLCPWYRGPSAMASRPGLATPVTT